MQRPTTIRVVTILLILFSTVAQGAEQRGQMPEDIDVRKVDIYSEGTRMTGYLYVSRTAASDSGLPAIVMAHGWGGTQRSLRRDAVGFARSGYLVMSFDYRGWGESDARVILTQPAPDPEAKTFTTEVRAVREVVDPLDMGTDWLNALHFIVGEPAADPARIGIWGSSMAGGYVIYAAAHDPRVKAVHSQVTGTLNGRAWGRSPDARRDATRRARGEIGYPEPREKFGNLTGAPITPRFADYTPNEDIHSNDQVALQFVLAESEEYGGNELAIDTYEQHKGPRNLVIIPDIGHYDVYRKAWQETHDHATAWFDKHLK
jgi:uncharacterized protein